MMGYKFGPMTGWVTYKSKNPVRGWTVNFAALEKSTGLSWKDVALLLAALAIGDKWTGKYWYWSRLPSEDGYIISYFDEEEEIWHEVLRVSHLLAAELLPQDTEEDDDMPPKRKRPKAKKRDGVRPILYTNLPKANLEALVRATGLYPISPLRVERLFKDRDEILITLGDGFKAKFRASEVEKAFASDMFQTVKPTVWRQVPDKDPLNDLQWDEPTTHIDWIEVRRGAPEALLDIACVLKETPEDIAASPPKPVAFDAPEPGPEIALTQRVAELEKALADMKEKHKLALIRLTAAHLEQIEELEKRAPA